MAQKSLVTMGMMRCIQILNIFEDAANKTRYGFGCTSVRERESESTGFSLNTHKMMKKCTDLKKKVKCE